MGMIVLCPLNLALHTHRHFPEEYEDKSRAEFFDQQTLDDDDEADVGALRVYAHNSKGNRSSREHAHMTSASRFRGPTLKTVVHFACLLGMNPLYYMS